MGVPIRLWNSCLRLHVIPVALRLPGKFEHSLKYGVSGTKSCLDVRMNTHGHGVHGHDEPAENQALHEVDFCDLPLAHRPADRSTVQRTTCRRSQTSHCGQTTRQSGRNRQGESVCSEFRKTPQHRSWGLNPRGRNPNWTVSSTRTKQPQEPANGKSLCRFHKCMPKLLLGYRRVCYEILFSSFDICAENNSTSHLHEL